ncbi:MAG: tRNA (cytidine(34)-2'-O)-methyltransferase [Cyanobacteriota bacterium]|nr:tRNA (cytidine(34)-2'-O)-methyltransferase [Cyanobacteriota bacterium]
MASRVVLVHPEIPPNTGNVARSCAAVGAELHLVEPLGFAISDRHLRRAGLDYWPWVDLHRHGDLQAFLEACRRRGGRLVALTAHGSEPLWSHAFRADDWLLFGRESDGLPPELLALADRRLTIPMPRSQRSGQGGVRSLNLSVAVGVTLFEALRQQQEQSAP